MASNEKFCLRWNDFEKNIGVAFRDIREEKDFFDCTLSCGARQIQAHKLILSACSPFFHSVLKQNPHQHPLLYLKGVAFNDLQYVLNFMYHGEVNVAQEELNSFLSAAEDLQIKGLTQNGSSTPTKPEPAREKQLLPLRISHPRPPQPEQTISCKLPQPQPQAIYNSNEKNYQPQQDDIQEVLPVVKTEPQPGSFIPSSTQNTVGLFSDESNMESMTREVASMDDNYVEEEYADYAEYDVQDYGAEQNTGINENILDDPNGLGFTCGLCGKCFGLNKHHCRRHIKNFHNLAVTVLRCDVCMKTYKNNDSLKNHLRITHGVYKK